MLTIRFRSCQCGPAWPGEEESERPSTTTRHFAERRGCSERTVPRSVDTGRRGRRRHQPCPDLQDLRRQARPIPRRAAALRTESGSGGEPDRRSRARSEQSAAVQQASLRGRPARRTWPQRSDARQAPHGSIAPQYTPAAVSRSLKHRIMHADSNRCYDLRKHNSPIAVGHCAPDGAGCSSAAPASTGPVSRRRHAAELRRRTRQPSPDRI